MISAPTLRRPEDLGVNANPEAVLRDKAKQTASGSLIDLRTIVDAVLLARSWPQPLNP
jgi:hypothetical protein